MENVNNNIATETTTAKMEDVVKTPEATLSLEGMNSDSLVDLALMMSGLKKVKTGNVLKDNKNLIGGLIGCAIATGLELASPTGSKSSAVMAAAASGGTLYLMHNVLDNAPQTTAIAGGTAALTAYVGMVAGRITADYFPGNMDISEE